MKIVRLKSEDGLQYGILEGERVVLCHGDPFKGLDKSAETLDLNSVKLAPPVSPPNIVCLGLNYKKHAEECNYPFPPNPLLFLKTTTALAGPEDEIIIPPHHPDKIDYEAELAVVIGKTARFVPEDSAAEYILGYTVANDVSNRGVQFQDGQWARGKSYDTFCPIGPCISTGLDAGNLHIECRLNGRVMQSSNTSDLIFPVNRLVSFISECMTLLPGTIILTGTPEGVGFTRTPPVFLQPGDVVECEIEGIGILKNSVSERQK